MRHKSNRESTPIALCFLEQNPISLTYLTHVLRGHEFDVLGEEEALEQRSSSPAGRLVLVVDEMILSAGNRVSMRSLRIRFPGARLLILATALPHGEQLQLLRGIDGFVLYSEAKTKLVPAIRALCDGHVWLPPEVLEYLARLALHADEKKLPLTLRETEVIRLIGEGLSNKEIGNKLGVTEKTVKFHASNVFAKLGVHDRNSAVEISHSLVAPPGGHCPPAESTLARPQKSVPHRIRPFPSQQLKRAFP